MRKATDARVRNNDPIGDAFRRIKYYLIGGLVGVLLAGAIGWARGEIWFAEIRKDQARIRIEIRKLTETDIDGLLHNLDECREGIARAAEVLFISAGPDAE